MWARKRCSVPSSSESATTPRQAPSVHDQVDGEILDEELAPNGAATGRRACAAWRGRCGRRRRRCAARCPCRNPSSCRRTGAGRSCPPRCARTARPNARARRPPAGALRQRYSMASWSPSQSDPLTVSYMCQRQSSSPMLPSAAAMPPCAATVCERVGKTLVMQAVFSPRLAGAERGAQARAAGADDDHVEGVLGHRIGAAVHRRRAVAPLPPLPLPFSAISASESELEHGEAGDAARRPRRRASCAMSSGDLQHLVVHVVLDDDLHADAHVHDRHQDAGEHDERDERRGERRRRPSRRARRSAPRR